MYYILDKNHNIKQVSIEEWFRTSKENNIIEQTFIPEYLVSTVFLGINYGNRAGDPVLFETMVFKTENGIVRDWWDLNCIRYCTYDEAVEGHKKMVEKWSNHEGRD